MGVDIGIAITGIGVIEKSGYKTQYISHTVIETHKDLSVPDRLAIIHKKFLELIDTFKPEIIAVEELFFFKNAKTIINVAQARGVVLLTIQELGLRFEEYTPLQVKQGISSYGRADKGQVQRMVKMVLNLSEIPKPDDAADALAIAWCCSNSISLKQ